MARPASDISHRIVEAARERFLLEGVDGASLRAIAKDAGTSIGMVYYYFPTKDDLFLGVVEDVYTVLLGDIRKALDGADESSEEKFRRLYHRIARISDVEFTVMRLILREAMVSTSRLSRLAELFQRGHVPIAVQTLLASQASGELRGDLNPLLLLVSAIALGIFPQIVRRRAGPMLPPGLVPTAEALADHMIDILFHGIRSPSAPPPVRRRAPKKKAPPRRPR